MCKLEFATLETRRPRGRLDRVNFRKDLWDCYWGQGKNWPIAIENEIRPIDDLRVPVTIPKTILGKRLG